VGYTLEKFSDVFECLVSLAAVKRRNSVAVWIFLLQSCIYSFSAGRGFKDGTQLFNAFEDGS